MIAVTKVSSKTKQPLFQALPPLNMAIFRFMYVMDIVDHRISAWNIGMAQKKNAVKFLLLGMLLDFDSYTNRVIHTTHEFPAQVNQRHKPYIVAPHDHFKLHYNTKLTTLSACT